jgi:hypothetical protein
VVLVAVLAAVVDSLAACLVWACREAERKRNVNILSVQ